MLKFKGQECPTNGPPDIMTHGQDRRRNASPIGFSDLKQGSSFMGDKKSVLIVGAGPGGLAAGMLLAANGYRVSMVEKNAAVGGRNSHLQAGDYTFDVGPTFFMMIDVLEKIFSATGRRLEDYVKLHRIDPLYHLHYPNGRVFRPTHDRETMKQQLEEWIPGSFAGYDKYMRREKVKFDRIIPCLSVPYRSPLDLLSGNFLRSIPYLDAHVNLFDHLGKYFDSPEQRLAFTFQAKYLGMSPWNCPGTFSILSFIEHSTGVYHVEGGLNRLSHAMAKVIEECGGEVRLSAEVEEILVENGKTVGVRLKGGETQRAETVVINADFAYALSRLIPAARRRKYTDERLRAMKYSCSTFMLYLGLRRKYPLAHHNIYFASDYKKNVEDISVRNVLPEDPSFYVHNPSAIDPTLAPAGKSAVYVLVPVANNTARIDWEREKEPFKEKILGLMETRAGMTGLRDAIEELRIITPADWESKAHVYLGATFNLAHTLNQMLFFRPRNEFEEFKQCYLVGGGTHPGSGLPTIYQSGAITARLILERDGKTVAW
jgi:phytoene desaturase